MQRRWFFPSHAAPAMNRILSAAASLSLLVALSSILSAADDAGFTPLFNGKDLAGWKKVGGGATYEIDGDAIVGKVGPGANTFLRTEKLYGNFIFKCEVKLDVPGNSGIQVRSHQQPGENGRVFGYQCEIDPSARAWTAGIYDEGRRGWLYPLEGKPEAQKSYKAGEWNLFVIECEGPSIRTWVNGVPCADLLDAMDMEGFIALQVHSGKEGQIRWRNIQIKEFGESKWAALDTSEKLAGWRKQGPGSWTGAEGVIHGTSPASEAKHSHLISEKTYGDFALRVQFKADKGNSGLYFRVEEGEPYGVKGFQAEVDATKDVGGLYDTAGRGWVVQPKPDDVKKWFKPGQWNTMTVICVGGRVVVHVNGHRTAELKDDPGRRNGHIALQLHGGQDMDVSFKGIEVMELGK